MAEQKTKLSIKDIKPDVRDIYPVKWPGGEREVNLLLLRCDEVQEAQFATVDFFKRKMQVCADVNYGEFLREKERQEVRLMILLPDSNNPKDKLFPTADELRKSMDLDEVAYFQRQHELLNTERLKKLGLLAGEPNNDSENK